MSYPSINPPVLSILALVAILLGSCELLGDTSSPDYGTITDISYTRHVQVLFSDRCQACHDGTGTPLALTSWAAMTAGSASGGPVIPFEPDRSRMMRMLTALPGGPHPAELGKETATPEEIDFLRRWIAEGARNDQGVVPYSGLSSRFLVALEDRATIAVIDPAGLAIARTIDLESLGFSPDSAPSAFALNPADNGWFVSLPGEGLILSFGPDDVLRGLVELDASGQMDASRDVGWLLSGGPDSGQQGTVKVVSTPSMQVRTQTISFPGIRAVAARPQGDYGYAVSGPTDQMAVFPLAGGLPTYVAVQGPRHEVSGLDVSLAGDVLVAAGGQSGQALLYDIAQPSNPVFLGLISMGSGLRSPVIQGQTLYALAGPGRILRAALSPGAQSATLVDVQEAAALAEAGGRLVATNPNDSGQLIPSHRFIGVTRVGSAMILDSSSGRVLRRIELDGRPVAALALDSGQDS